MGPSCRPCASALQRGWPEVSWAQACLKKQVDAIFAKEILDARAFVAKNKELPPFILQSFDTCHDLGYVMEDWHLWLSEEQFERQFGKKANSIPEVAPLLQTLKGPDGTPTTGLLVAHPTHGEMPIVKRISFVGSLLCNKLLRPEDQIRPDQALAVSNAVRKATMSGTQNGIVTKSIPKMEEVKGWLERAPAPEPQPVAAQPAAEVVEPAQDMEEIIDTVGGVNLVEALRPSAKAKAKSKTKAKAKADAHGVKRKYAQSIGGAVCVQASVCNDRGRSSSRTEVSPSDAGDGVSNRSRSPMRRVPSGRESAIMDPTSYDKLASKAREYIDDTLSLPTVLVGLPKLRSLVYQAGRTQTALESIEHRAVDALNLKAHLDLVELASQVAAPVLPNLKKNARSDILPKVCPHVREFPLQWQVQWLAVYVRDMALDTEASVKLWVDAVSPVAAGPAQPLRVHIL